LQEKKKIYIPTGPEFGDIDFRKLLIGPRGMTQKAMEERFGCKILIRGRGSQKDGGVGMGTEDDLDDLHVCVEGDLASVDAAHDELARIMSSPDEAQRLKTEQLASLAAMNGAGGGGGALTLMGCGSGHYGPGSGGGMSRPGLGFGQDGDVTEVIQVPNGMVGSLIGKGGETIQAMQRNSGCHVQIARDPDGPPGCDTRSVTLKGSSDAIVRAKAEIARVLDERTTPRGQQQQGSFQDAHTIKVKVRGEAASEVSLLRDTSSNHLVEAGD
jgi:hypothetical protein